MGGLNNIKKYAGIFTHDVEKAEEILIDLSVKNKYIIKRFINRKEHKELQLINGESYIWIKPINMSRGYRVSKCYIDLNMTVEEFLCIVQSICIYCGRNDFKII